MGLFDKFFAGSGISKEQDSTPWIDLNTMDQLDAIMERSKTKTQLIFKHSTRCGISRMVIGQFKKYYSSEERATDLYYLDLIQYRNLSNEVADRFDVRHESPQLLVIRNEAVVSHASHGAINDIELEKLV
ncbi:MAG TPA: bacillithiol system redox-active protein YtxJ [Aquaticitalea sp.]|nr:bacillithiol system redox-active protein YtxJ [Aquaticitalea sp.]